MSFLARVFHWFTAASHWHGANGIPHRALEHAFMSGGAVLIALVIAVPVGVGLGHAGRGGSAAINVGNIGRALPSFGILVLFAQVFGLRGWPGFGGTVWNFHASEPSLRLYAAKKPRMKYSPPATPITTLSPAMRGAMVSE